MRRVRLAWPAWAIRATRARQPRQHAVRPSTRPRVALAIQAAYAAQAAAATPSHWAVYGWGREPYDRYEQPARSPFDARRAQAWQTIDLTLAELRAS